jgi:DNA polymerase V
MLKHQNPIYINATTTGFASPAETYVDKRLDLNELIVKDFYTTFYFKYSGPEVFGIKQGDTLVIDRNEEPKTGDLVVLTEKTFLIDVKSI